MQAGSGQAIYFSGRSESYGKAIGYTYSSATALSKSVGLTTDSNKSGIVADLSALSTFAPYFYIKH